MRVFPYNYEPRAHDAANDFRNLLLENSKDSEDVGALEHDPVLGLVCTESRMLPIVCMGKGDLACEQGEMIMTSASESLNTVIMCHDVTNNKCY